MGILSVTTRDAATGAPTGSRVHLTAPDGKFYAPADAYARVGAQGDHVFHHAGRFTVEVPAGRTELTVVKGFEYRPQEVAVEVGAGEVAELTVELRRMTDMAAKGWYSGSTHVHMNYGGNLHNTLENLVMMSAAEDQDVVNEQVANKDNRILDHQFFVRGGGPHPASTPEHLVVVGQEYRPPFYGHVFMFGMRDHLISPFTMGYEGTAIESLYPSNTDMFRKAKAQGATVGYVHAFGGEADPLDGNLGGGKGFMVDAALGTTDARGVVRLWPGRILPGLRHLEQRTAGDRHRRRGLHQQPAQDEDRRLRAHLRAHRRPRAGHGRVVRGTPRGTCVRLVGSSRRADRERAHGR